MTRSQKTPELPPTRNNVRESGKQGKKSTSKGSKRNVSIATTDSVATQNSIQDIANHQHVAQTETKNIKNMV
jgi:hypothetical protein